ADLRQREEQIARQGDKLKETGRAVAAERKALVEERARVVLEQQKVEEVLTQARAAGEAARKEALALQQRLPELELQAGTALERLTHAREQLREHLGQVHDYAQQCQDDLEGLRGQV